MHDTLLNCTMIVSCTEYHVIVAITVAAAAIVAVVNYGDGSTYDISQLDLDIDNYYGAD